ncbi:uncharacterized protein DSM5745_07937 [Aspergillus mulundensis]|uniref:Uncharacterized protein n=1 Tax=Aspergillus mulundensis TaxID=1810919 RepID=A0A3D8RFE2_9EURO|nr:Uncharacterized protein DSM5745_07937 [Aspergillus mulundensis]RDW72765.1 Uncharacterized protein DSM5745_07937 [Aspergillus mulundensis]
MRDKATSTTIQDDCKDAVQAFVSRLSTEEKLLFQATDTSEKLINDLVEADNKHSKASVSRRIAPRIQSFVAGIDRFSGAIDAIAGSVSLMQPIWGGCKVVLQIAKDYSEYFDRLSEMFEEIGYNLGRLRRFPRLYPDNDVLTESMVDIFQAILEFCSKARAVFRQGKNDQSSGRLFSTSAVSFRAAWKVVWKPFTAQFGDIMDRINTSMSRIEQEVDLAEKELASEGRAKAEGERKLQAARWDKLESRQKRVTDYIDQQKVAQLNQWLSPVNAAANHNSATKLRQAGTGTWFVDGQPFQDWLSRDNSFLWLHAIPGAGKTILASTVIDWLRQHKEDQDTGLVYFYCDYKDKQKQSPTTIVSTLLSMIATRNEAVLGRLVTFFEQQHKENPAYTPEFDELLNNFSHFVSDSFDQLFIVVDALDETEDRECVAYAFRKIAETCDCAKVLVTSRYEIDIARTYEELPITSIEPDDIAGDIELYIRSEVAAKIKAKKLKLRDPKLQEVICETLIQGAHGMFQWVKCQIDQLCKLRNDRALRNALDDLPKTLHDTYIRILRRLEAERADEVPSVQRLLRWLVRGTRNLTLDELAECVSIDPDGAEDSFDFDAVFTDPEDVVELCGSLVVISPDGYVALAHYTVKEFLVSAHIQELMPHFWVGCAEVHTELARVCLTYLCYDDFSTNYDEPGDELLQRFEEYKFLKYAVQGWGAHAHLSEGDEQVFDLTMRLFELDEKENYGLWCHIYRHLHKASGQRPTIPRSDGSPLYFASLFGLPKVVLTLLENDPDLDMVEPIKAASFAGHSEVVKVILEHCSSIEPKVLENCLYVAASNGHEHVAKLLLQQQVNPNAAGGKQGTPLQVAALEGRHQVIATLLEYGADKNVTSQRYGSPLAAAAEKSHMRTVQLLLDHGANVNKRGGWYGYPLTSAIVGKNMPIVDLLIDKGADLNALGGRHGCPLMAAASMGMLDLIRSLVARGAKVNDENDKGSDSLYAACIAERLDAVELLLDLGADVNAKGGRHRNALNAASASGNIEIVERLLAAGANVDFFDEHYGNSIQVAAAAGYNDVIRILAEAGVDVNAPAGDRGTALISAAQSGHTETVQLLFDLGVTSGDTDEMTNALMVAARKGYTPVVEVLVEMGADIDGVSTMATYPKCTALEAAAVKSHAETVQSLLDLGADVNYENNGEYGCALIAAIFSDKDYSEVVSILLDADADVSATVDGGADGGGCPLGAAVFKKDYDLCSDLIDRGAEVNVTNEWFYTPLQLAVIGEDERIVDLLVDHGADVNLAIESTDKEDDNGIVTALQVAAMNGSEDMVRKLIGLGANLSDDVEDSRFKSALQVASFEDHQDVVQILIDAGSDVNEIGGLYGTSLQAAAFQGAIEAAKALLEAGADVNISGVGERGNALIAAASNSHEDMVKLLIEHGADVNVAGGESFYYALHAASNKGCDEIVLALIEAGADINAQGGMYGTALIAACVEGHLDTCQLLLERGADPNIVCGRYGTALAAAYKNGYYEVLDLLYSHGASHTLKGGEFGTPLGSAVRGSCETLVDACIRRHGADPNLPVGEFGSALQSCIIHRGDDAWFILLEAGADANARSGVRGTPLIAAASMGELEIAKFLLDHYDAGVNLEGNDYYPTAVHGAIEGDSMDILKLLVERGANVNAANSRLGSPLEFACSLGRVQMVRYLLRHGAEIDPKAKGRYGDVLQAAAISRWGVIVRFLLNRGADIHKKGGKHGSALMASVLSCNLFTVELLLKQGADVNARGGVYGYPLQAAAAKGSESSPMILLLLRYGADINAKGGKYGTALQAACVSGDYDLVQLLLERGADVNVTAGFCRNALHAAALWGNDHIVELLMKSGAQWSLVDRSLSHFAPSTLDFADEILVKAREDQRNGWPEDEESEDEDDEDDESEDEDESDSEDFQLNVESIPLFDEPYRPAQARAVHQDENGEALASADTKDSGSEDWTELEWLQIKDGDLD